MIRWIKNFIGSYLGYCRCPNCGDNWWWKPEGTIPFKGGGGIRITTFGRQLFESMTSEEFRRKVLSNELPVKPVLVFPITALVMMCCECLKNPESIDEQRVSEDLKRYEWGDEDIELVVNAIKKLKAA